MIILNETWAGTLNQIIREGDPVQRMVFVVKGQIRSSQRLSGEMTATCTLGPGNSLGDELLSWCLHRPFADHLPVSSATFECVEATEAFGLDATQLRYITEHFRYKFAIERLKRTARYYSASWRTWAAVNIQLAWRHYRKNTRGVVTAPLCCSVHVHPTSRSPWVKSTDLADESLRCATAAIMLQEFMSYKSHNIRSYFLYRVDYWISQASLLIFWGRVPLIFADTIQTWFLKNFVVNKFNGSKSRGRLKPSLNNQLRNVGKH